MHFNSRPVLIQLRISGGCDGQVEATEMARNATEKARADVREYMSPPKIFGDFRALFTSMAVSIKGFLWSRVKYSYSPSLG